MAGRHEVTISDLGFTILHNPQQPIADIVIVHGLGGHPYKSFSAKAQPSSSTSTLQPGTRPPSTNFLTKSWKKFLRHQKSNNRYDTVPSQDSNRQASSNWPRDFLPRDCEDSRILVWGYDSKVTNGYSASNQNNLFGHSRDLLYSLRRDKPARRPLIFVAHSLGGLVIKEMLRRSEASSEFEVQDVVKSTAGVIFLGTPHRGSPEIASLAEVIRNIAGAILRVDSNPTLIRALGIDSPELELSRESFIAQWRAFNFKVKTFQEAYGPMGINIGPLNKKTVPDRSSCLDDPREHAETIPADHENICKFGSSTDIGYTKIAAEIRLILKGLTDRDSILTEQGQDFLRSLHFEMMYVRQKNIRIALDNTCNWLFSREEYLDWIERRNATSHHGLLWIKGKPGAGKSTLMKEALSRIELQNAKTETTVTGFFFNARSTDILEKSPLGLYRSILHQVLQQDLKALAHFVPEYMRRKNTQAKVEWHEEDLQKFLIHIFATPSSRPAIIFIDALDECDDNEVHQLVDFFRDLTTKAFISGAKLNICLSSRHYPHISINNCPEVIVERNNENDILEFIQKEASYIDAISRLQDKIFKKSQGVFLWVVLVVSILKKSSYGKSLKWMEEKLEEIPPELNTLFQQLFSQVNAEDAPKAVSLMQWILFALKPIRMFELHLIIAFSGETSYSSIESWQNSKDFLTPDAQFQMIIDLSKGLLEPVFSFNNAKPDQIFQFIHESVRDFFLKGRGFEFLEPQFSGSIKGNGHNTIVRTGINILRSEEFTHLACYRETIMDTRTGLYYYHNNQEAVNYARSRETNFRIPPVHPGVLEYFNQNLFLHIELAEQEGVSQCKVLNLFLSNNEDLISRLQRLYRPVPESEELRRFTLLGECVPSLDGDEMGVLNYCAYRALYFCVKRLLDMGQNPNLPGLGSYIYPLLYSVLHKYKFVFGQEQIEALKSQEKVLALLLHRGADVKVVNFLRESVLHLAARRGAPGNFLTLLECGADPTVEDVNGNTPWQLLDTRFKLSGRVQDGIEQTLRQQDILWKSGDPRS